MSGPSMRHYQRGVTTVEFAIVGAVFFTLIFGVIEFGRALFVANILVEGTRRGARMAAVCPVGSIRAAQAAIFANAEGVSSIDPNLRTANVVVSYLDQAGAPLANPGANFTSIAYVQVRIVDFRQTMMIPGLPDFLIPAFTATLPAESLGYWPSDQAFSACP